MRPNIARAEAAWTERKQDHTCAEDIQLLGPGRMSRDDLFLCRSRIAKVGTSYVKVARCALRKSLCSTKV